MINNHVIYFRAPVEPQGKSRPRFVRRGNYTVAYTPKKTKDFETLIQGYYRQYVPQGRIFQKNVPLAATVTANFAIPASWPKKKREAAIKHEIYPTVKPDADNIGKAVLDALNGLAYEDDKQVVWQLVMKQYEEEPSVEVMIRELWRGENMSDDGKGVFFFFGWRDTLRECIPDPVARAEAYDAIIDYAQFGQEPEEFVSEQSKMFFMMAKPLIDSERGRKSKGGQPGNQNAKKTNQNESETNEKRIENESKRIPPKLDQTRTRIKTTNYKQEQESAAVAAENKNKNSNALPAPAAADFEQEIKAYEKEQDFKRVVEAFEKPLGRMLSSFQIEELQSYLDMGMQPDVLCEAARKVDDTEREKHNWHYVRGILRPWAQNKVFTLDDVRREDAEHERRKQQRQKDGRAAPKTKEYPNKSSFQNAAFTDMHTANIYIPKDELERLKGEAGT